MALTLIKRSKNEDTNVSSSEAVAKGLEQVLADSFGMYVKTLHYHWNVEGPMFVAIHTLTEDHYKNLTEAIDDVAERIRMLGYYVSASLDSIAGMSTIKVPAGKAIDSKMDIAELEQDHQKIVSILKEVMTISDLQKDAATSDLIAKRLDFHEKAAWMLRSFQK